MAPLATPVSSISGYLLGSLRDQAADRGVRRVWLFKGAGKGAVSDDAIGYCRAHGVDVVEGACPLMFLEPVRGVHRFHRFISPRARAASRR